MAVVETEQIQGHFRRRRFYSVFVERTVCVHIVYCQMGSDQICDNVNNDIAHLCVPGAAPCDGARGRCVLTLMVLVVHEERPVFIFLGEQPFGRGTSKGSHRGLDAALLQ